MNAVYLLDSLKTFTEDAIKDLILPVRIQKGDTEQAYRPAAVYKMRLPDSTSAQKKVPYIIHQILTGKDQQTQGQRIDANVQVRSIFAVYNEDEQEGGLMLLNLMERYRIAILKQVVIGDQFALDLESGVERIVYPDDTAPYYMGEMVTTWKMPPVQREVFLR